MRTPTVFMLMVACAPALAADLRNLPANTFVEMPYKTIQPPGGEQGFFARQGWNKIVYDPDGRRVLFYDRWIDKTHGGGTIYGNCLFSFDPAAATLTPVKIDNWSKRDLFFAVVSFKDNEQPSGVFRYDPAKNAWSEIRPANPIPPHNNWFGWMRFCYDAANDCLIGKVNETFYAYRP